MTYFLTKSLQKAANVHSTDQLQMRGGARMKVSRFLCSIALVGLTVGMSAAVAHADGSDGRLGTKPIPPTDPPPCQSVQFMADANRAVVGDSAICGDTANTRGIDAIAPNSAL